MPGAGGFAVSHPRLWADKCYMRHGNTHQLPRFLYTQRSQTISQAPWFQSDALEDSGPKAMDYPKYELLSVYFSNRKKTDRRALPPISRVHLESQERLVGDLLDPVVPLHGRRLIDS